MDNFIDKLAQKFTAGEVIKANSAAEERELKRLREQVAEYERCLQEMRQVQMVNTQTARNLHDMMAESTDSIHDITRESLEKIKEIKATAELQETDAKETIDAAKEAVEQMQQQVKLMQDTIAGVTASLEKNQEEVEQWFKQADDFLHKENVKVYRNVQAVIVDEVGNKAENIIKVQDENSKKNIRPVLIFSILGFAAAASALVLQIFSMLGIRLM